MMSESGCSRKNLGAWREYHQHRQHSHNILKGQLSYQAKLLNLGMTLAPELPSPNHWGWSKDDAGWHPLWTTFPEAPDSCHE